VLAVYVSGVAGASMQSVPLAHLEAGRGIAGDRYHAGIGTFSRPASTKPDQEVTLVESEEIDEFNHATGLKLDYGALRRNIVTADVRLNDLVGVRFSVGDALLEGIRLCEPCTHLARLATDRVLPGLTHRAGLRARILSGGTIRPSDPIAIA
jgi:MOSC domain-containing protein YiiM